MVRSEAAWLGRALTILVVLAAVFASEAPAAVSQPNVLLVVTDDQRLDTMEALPDTVSWLGGGGVTFDNAVVTTPLCCPARGSFFSGQFVHNHGIRDLDDAPKFDHRQTLQYTLQRAGYRTGIAGKYFNYWDLCNDDPPYFDRFAIFFLGFRNAPFRVDRSTGESYEPNEGETSGDIANGVCEGGGDGQGELAPYSTTYIGEKANEFLHDFERDDDDPWFLYVAPFAPHGGAHSVEKRYRDAPVSAWQPTPAVGEVDVSDKPPHIRDLARGKTTTPTAASANRTRMLRTLMSVDDMNASIRQTLAELDEEENTLVLYMSDGGFLWAEHSLSDKREPYEPSVRVPFYAAWPACSSAATAPKRGCPGALEASTRDGRIAANIDVAPTIYDAAGIRARYTVDGESLFSAARRDKILIEHFPGGPWWRREPAYRAFWSPDWLYRENQYADEGMRGCYDDDPATECVRYADQPIHDELYDMRTDPFQLDNQLAHREPDLGLWWLSLQLRAAETCRGWFCRALMRGGYHR